MSEKRAEYEVIGCVSVQLRPATLLLSSDPDFKQPTTGEPELWSE